jgi:hypothetical protein
VLGRDSQEGRLDVGGTRGVDLLGLLPGQLDRAITGRIRVDPGVVEHHRTGTESLADRLAGDALLVQSRDDGHEVGRLERVDGPLADERQQLVELDAVLLARRGGDVDARGAPGARGLLEDELRFRLAGEQA